ncbi:MAG: DUF1761 domain-containing protein [Rhodospirillaceae bacterium]|nr:DUF1761 domain-containing protein [Rhodospirillaceae bacterium]
MPIDYMGVGAATVVAMIIGALWYSPVLFLKPWMLAQGKEYPCPPQKGAAAAITNAAAMSIISALALSEVFSWRQVNNIEDALVTSLLMAVGFVVSNQLLRDRFHGATPMLSLINAANTVVTYLAMGLVMALV